MSVEPLVLQIDAIAGGAEILFSWPTFGWMVLGIILGIILGAIPGIGPAIGMALLLPLSGGMAGENAIILFVSVYLGAKYGGSISAILINTPGTAGAAATTLDGYPMSRNGLAITALSISATASFIGGIIAIVLLFGITPFLRQIVLAFGSPEYFLVAFLGIAMITVVARGGMMKGLIAGAFGMLITTAGFAPATGDLRYASMQHPITLDGIDFVAVLIGVFAVGEMIRLSRESGGIASSIEEGEEGGGALSGSRREGINHVVRNPVTVVKSALIGMGVGAIPGAGTSVSNFVAYGEALRVEENPDSFGEGNPRGVMSSESANSATVAGTLIPTLSFGIPGSGATAVLLGALLLHGLRPGPQLFSEFINITYSFYIALLVGNFIILVVGLTAIAYLGYITKVDTDLIIPVVIVMAMFGSFAVRNNILDVATVAAFGVIGYFMVKNEFSIIALVLGVVLGPIAERNLYRSLQINPHDGIRSFEIFLVRPISVVLLICIFLIIFGPFIKATVIPRVRGS